jgi:hypothetical protein
MSTSVRKGCLLNIRIVSCGIQILFALCGRFGEIRIIVLLTSLKCLQLQSNLFSCVLGMIRVLLFLGFLYFFEFCGSLVPWIENV